MTGGSIYIDPDGVTSVSNQMLKTADEIDALRRNIVPQVYNVIDTSYPVLGNMPEIGLPLMSTQEGIGGFSYEAETVVQEIRAAAYTLNQVASEGRLMMEQLLQQAVMLGSPIGSNGGSAAGSSWFQQLEGQLGGDWNATASIVESILNSNQFKTGADIVGSVVGLLGLDGIAGALVGTAFDIAANGDWNPRNASGDIIGGGIAFGVSFIPVVGEIVDGLTLESTINHLEATGLSWGQGLLAQGFSGNIKNQLQDSSQNWSLVAQNSSISPVFDSLGLAVTDVGIGIATGNFSNVPGDFGNAGLDAGKFALSFAQMDVNMDATIVDDTLAVGDKAIQVLPLPQSFKNATNSAVGTLMQSSNDIADFVTKPDDVVSAWNTVKGWL